MWMYMSLATLRCRYKVSCSRNALRRAALSLATTSRSSAAVLHCRTLRISSLRGRPALSGGCALCGCRSAGAGRPMGAPEPDAHPRARSGGCQRVQHCPTPAQATPKTSEHAMHFCSQRWTYGSCELQCGYHRSSERLKELQYPVTGLSLYTGLIQNQVLSSAEKQ